MKAKPKAAHKTKQRATASRRNPAPRYTFKTRGKHGGRGVEADIFRNGVFVEGIPPQQTFAAGDTDNKAAARAARERIFELKQMDSLKRRRNPDETAQAAELYEAFHGKAANKVQTIEEIEQEPESLADLGKLILLQTIIAGDRGDKLATLEFKGNVRVAASPDGGQIYFVGGDQALDLEALGLAGALPKAFVEVGEAYKIVYRTVKGFHNFEVTDYEHEFGEESGYTPMLNYDVLNRKLFLTGGRYQVRPEGITD